MNQKFHLALTVSNLENTVDFYNNILKFDCQKIFSEGQWLAFINLPSCILAFTEGEVPINLVCSEDEQLKVKETRFVNKMHFGLTHLSLSHFNEIIKNVESRKIDFLCPPTTVDKNNETEQTFAFIQDPDNYIVELRTNTDFNFERMEEFLQQNKQKTAVPYNHK